MRQLPLEQQFLLLFQDAALILLCVRIWRSQLYRTYKYFSTYLLADLVQVLVLSVTPYDRPSYVYVWLATEGTIVCFYALIVLEMYTIVLRELTGLAGIARRYVFLSMSVAILVSLLLLAFEKSPPSPTGHFLIFERAIVGSLVACVLLITAFLVYYPVPLSRNTIAYTAGYVVYFLAKAAALFVRNVSPAWHHQVSTTLIVTSLTCLLFWLFALSPKGEVKRAVVGHRWHPEDEDRLISQLRAINETVSRSVRKRL